MILETVTTTSVVAISLASLSLLGNLLLPVAVGVGYFIKHIKKSDCCGSTVELRQPSKRDLKNIEEEVIKRLSNNPVNIDLSNYQK